LRHLSLAFLLVGGRASYYGADAPLLAARACREATPASSRSSNRCCHANRMRGRIQAVKLSAHRAKRILIWYDLRIMGGWS
jgi:hypothetical protein